VKYALLIYGTTDARDALSEDNRRRINADIFQLLARPDVSSWVRLQPVESATTVRHDSGRTLLTDGPFVDSKEYLGGLIVIDAANLDEALAAAGEFQAALARFSGAVEVRPILAAE
jgi:hypothetical protein